ncbi:MULTISPECIES: hypothetical protein [Pantoea]|uniref:hypothetical protein n=1 Tax=Pantoea TaxID=53335 RepID=UPI000EA39BF6|nr:MULTISPECIES: hypothetical protein [Pantoea]MBZ6385493.1 hypothetical protein [Pantoea piersonii]MBZ6398963.1 hypothetical protein [Pantoea piersonii]MBZ6407539.1 hypothetical protein [Pantoea piersonii]MBZ6425510.1 hypothetical protein [Pantoea piersonii]NYB00966.1 hypothetical protein [Pantoea piersonii]
MKLSWRAKQEVEEIIKNLSETDLERIGEEVDAMMDQHKINPLMMKLCEFLPKHFDYPAVEMVDEDDEQYEAAEHFLRDAMVKVAKREMAIGIYCQRHGNMEAA